MIIFFLLVTSTLISGCSDNGNESTQPEIRDELQLKVDFANRLKMIQTIKTCLTEEHYFEKLLATENMLKKHNLTAVSFARIPSRNATYFIYQEEFVLPPENWT